MGEHFKTFIKKGSPIGVAMVSKYSRFGLLPDMNKDRCIAAPNIQSVFWIDLYPWACRKCGCKWTMGLTDLELPVRHGEGRVVFIGKEKDIYRELLKMDK